MSESDIKRGARKVREGVVVSDKMDKTVVVAVEQRVKHPLYGKVMTRSERLKAHDETNDAGTGDRVRIMETRPTSATKRWRLIEVIERANDSPYGLAGAVWSRNIEQAVEIAKRLETGNVWINQNLQNGPHIPFTGFKQSGFGVENGLEGLKSFTQMKAIYIPKAQVTA